MNLGEEVVLRCRDYIAANDFLAAEKAIAQLTALEGYRAEAGYLKGMLNFKQGDHKAACDAIDESLAFDGNAIEALELKLRILMMQGENASAADLSATLVARAPNSIGVLNLCAKALVKAGRISEAVEAWRRIAEIAPADGTPLIAIATAYFRAKFYDDAFVAAVLAFEREGSARAIVLAADSAAKAKNLAKLAWAAVRLAELDGKAALKYTHVLAGPDHVTAAAEILLKAGTDATEEIASIIAPLTKAARGAERAGDDAAAARAWSLVLQLDPTHQKAQASLRRYISGLMKAGVAFFENGESAEAISVFRKIVALDPVSGTARRKLAVALNREGDFPGEADAWRSLALLTGDSEAWQRALRASRKSELSETQLLLFVDARTHLEGDAELIERGNSLARKLGKRALLQIGEEPVAESLRALKAVEAWDGESPFADKLRARLKEVLQAALRSDESPEETRTITAENILAIDPVNLYALQWLSRVHLKARRFEAASSVLEKLIELVPQEASYWQHLSRCRKALKKPELSKEPTMKQAAPDLDAEAGAELEKAAAA